MGILHESKIWIKDKWTRFKTWFIFGFLGVGIALAAPLLIPNDLTEYITAPENNGYKIGVQNYQQEFTEDITNDRPLQYKLDDKFISFKPTRMYFDGLIDSKVDVKTSLRTSNLEYKEVFGIGIDLKMNLGERVWQKLITINSLKDLGTIPATAQNLIIEFEIETNFIIDGWDKKTDLEIIDKIRLGDFSYIKQASVWDSYREEVCTDPEEPELCKTLTNRQKIKTVLSVKNDRYFVSKHIPIEWLKDALYPVWTDIDITYGTEQTFTSNFILATKVREIDTDKFAVCYRDNTEGNAGKCIVGTVSGTTITFGTIAEFDDDIIGNPGICKVDTDKFAIAYADDGAADDGFTEIATVSGTTITFDDANRLEFNDSDTEDIGCGQLATDKYALAFNDETAGDDGYAVVCTVSTTTPTCGTKSEFADGITRADDTSVCKVDSTDFVVIYEDTVNTNIEARVANTTGTTINSWGTNEVLDTTGNATYDSCDQLDTDKIVFSWRGASTFPSLSRICTVDGSQDMTCGTTATIGGVGALGTVRAGVTKIDATQFVIAFDDNDNGGFGTSVLSTYSGTTITPGSEEVFGDSNDAFHTIDLISTNKVVICWAANSTDGECIIGDVSAVAPPAAEGRRKPGVIFVD